MTLIEQARQPIRELVGLMLYKLKVHEHKSHWSDMDAWGAYSRLEEERDELRKALMKWSLNPTLENWQEVEYEAADCANFLMMLIDNQRSTTYSVLRDNPVTDLSAYLRTDDGPAGNPSRRDDQENSRQLEVPKRIRRVDASVRSVVIDNIINGSASAIGID